VNPQLPLFPYATAGLAARYADSRRRRRKVKYIYQGAGVTSEKAAMSLYRAIYQPTDGGKRIRAMTFAAPDAEHAVRIAEDWELRADRLLTVKRAEPRRLHGSRAASLGAIWTTSREVGADHPQAGHQS